MLLPQQDVELCFKLHRALMFFVNQRLQVVADAPGSPDQFSALAPETRLKVRDAFLQHTDLIDAFITETRPACPPTNWKSFVPGGISWRAVSTFFAS